ncbi:hypothetical protein F4680DRAFT_124294 [Xylaria scruposa]|nr:hypothetical protein F4680DRAFT_124294 [Xylaria scruposa]
MVPAVMSVLDGSVRSSVCERIDRSGSPSTPPSVRIWTPPIRDVIFRSSPGICLDINPPHFSYITLKTKSIVILSRFGSPIASVSTTQPDKTTVPAKLAALNMSLALPAGAVVATSASTPTTGPHHGSRIFTNLVSALQLTRLLSLFLQASVLAFGLLYLSLFASVQIFQAARTIMYHSIQFSKQAAWRLWDSKHGRQLRKKVEFEFFTLILGGGNNLCLIIFWPGWPIISVVTLVLLAWYAT